MGAVFGFILVVVVELSCTHFVQCTQERKGLHTKKLEMSHTGCGGEKRRKEKMWILPPFPTVDSLKFWSAKQDSLLQVLLRSQLSSISLPPDANSERQKQTHTWKGRQLVRTVQSFAPTQLEFW